jgi:hypothetical protein
MRISILRLMTLGGRTTSRQLFQRFDPLLRILNAAVFETKRLGAPPNRQWSVGQPASVHAMPQLPVTPS